MRILVTGAAGFIGFHVAQRLLAAGHAVVGLDNLNDYYDPALKHARLARLQHPAFTFHRLDLADRTGMEALFAGPSFDRVIHLAAQAGVRYSLTDPHAYIASNLVGMLHVLEGCRHSHLPHLVFASSSSVYGLDARLPWSEGLSVDHPVSLYAATKKADELMAHSYSHLFRLPITGLRFFTVYGPWGRPDMAYYSFAEAIRAGQPIAVNNHGHMRRDFTYVDDIVEAVLRIMDQPATPDPAWNPDRPDPATSSAPYRIYNLGNHTPVDLLEFIHLLEAALGRTARLELRGMQAGDVVDTHAEVSRLQAAIGFTPATPLAEGLRRFAAWFHEYRG